jgi:hypothetical protein
LPGNSQTLLNDSTCAVPCGTLKNALIMQSDYKLTQVKLNVARDTISILTKKSLEQDSVIFDYKNLIVEKDTIIKIKSDIIVQRDLQIVDLNKNVRTLKTQRNGVIIGASAAILLTIVLNIVF